MSKQQQREQLLRDVQAFLDKGGKVQKVKAKALPVQRKVTA